MSGTQSPIARIVKPKDLWRVLQGYFPHEVTCSVGRSEENVHWCAVRLFLLRPVPGNPTFVRGPSPFVVELTYSNDTVFMSYGPSLVAWQANGQYVHFYFLQADCPRRVGPGWMAVIRFPGARPFLTYPIDVLN